jgi:hypothetical protein
MEKIHFFFMQNEDRRIEGEKMKIMGDSKLFSWMDGKEVYGNDFLN